MGAALFPHHMRWERNKQTAGGDNREARVPDEASCQDPANLRLDLASDGRSPLRRFPEFPASCQHPPADLLSTHVEEQIGGGQAENDAIDVQGAGV